MNSRILLVFALLFCLLPCRLIAEEGDIPKLDSLFTSAEYYLSTNPDSFELVSTEIEDLIRSQGDTTDLMKLYLYRGIRQAMQNNLDLALINFQRVWKFAYKSSDMGLQISSLNNIAGIYRYNGNYQKAEEYMKKALEVQDPLNKITDDAHLMLSLAMVVDVQNRLEEAEELLRDALKIFKEEQEHEMIMKTMTELGFILEKREEFQQAASLYESMIPLYEIAGNSRSVATTKQRLGGVYLELGNYRKGYDLLSYTLNLSDSIDFQVQKDTTLIWLIKASAHLGKLSETDMYLNQLTEYHREQETKNLKEALNELENEHVLQSQQLENDILRAESENQKLELANVRTTLIGSVTIILVLVILFVVVYRYNQKIKSYSQQLTEANEELEKHVQAKTELLDSRNLQLIQASFALAHEIRAKVSTIMGATSLLDTEELSEDHTKELLHAVTESSHELDLVVRDLISRLED